MDEQLKQPAVTQGIELALEIRSICDTVRESDRRIRHVGYYDGFGRIIYDSVRPNRKPMENTEEMHILNGTVASTLNLWKPANKLIGKVTSFVMIRDKLVGVIVPYRNSNYVLVIFEKNTKLDRVEKVRSQLLKALKNQ